MILKHKTALLETAKRNDHREKDLEHNLSSLLGKITHEISIKPTSSLRLHGIPDIAVEIVVTR